MRIIAGSLRGRVLSAPPGAATRPTADRARQALFDMLWHAPWAGRAAVDGAHVLDAFAGTGALGLEALSRGAAQVTFIENNKAALKAIRDNIGACRVEAQCRLLVADATRPPPAPAPFSLVFLDPPYGQDLAPRALAALRAAGWIAPGALVVVEVAAEENPHLPGIIDSRTHGAARIIVLREPPLGQIAPGPCDPERSPNAITR